MAAKQLFNGTVVTVEDIEVKRAESAAVTRKARNRQASGRIAEPDTGTAEPEYSVHITARTDDGRRVTFRHDEIRDWHDNIRLDYGYAMTIASAQGLTVDRAFLLVDDRPARETIYPAATRHREGIDVYVNRSPLAFDIAERRPEDQADMPVTDSDVRAYLAERWSRSEPKEAALDYVSEGAWRDAREDERRRRPGPGGGQGEAAEARAAANDNAIVRIAREISHVVDGWRHGAAVDAFAAERQEVLASWDDLRERTRTEGDAVALSDAYRETLDRHSALMKQAASFKTRPQIFEGLLAERAGIGGNDLDEFQHLHERAHRHRRAATMRQVHQTRRETESQDVQPQQAEAVRPEGQQGTLALEGGRGEAPLTPVPEPPRPDWRTLYDELERDWNDLAARANERNLRMTLMGAYDALIGRVRALAEHPGLSEHARGVLDELLAYHNSETVARETAQGWLADAERHVERWKALERQADENAMAVARTDDYPAWREAARTLAATGKTILGNEGRYGAYLDAPAAGKPRARLVVDQLCDRIETPRNSVGEWLAAARRHMEARGDLKNAAPDPRAGLTASKGYPTWREEAERLMEEGKDVLSGRAASQPHADGEPTAGERLMRRAFSQLGETIGEDDKKIAARKARKRRERATEWSRLRFADEPAGAAVEAKPQAGSTNEVPEWAQTSRSRRALGRDRQATIERSSAASLERWQRLKRQWNRQLERAEEQGVHIIYTKGFGDLHRHLRSMADDAYLESRIRGNIGDVLQLLEEAQARREHVESTRDRLLDRLERRDGELGFGSSRDRRPAPDRRYTCTTTTANGDCVVTISPNGTYTAATADTWTFTPELNSTAWLADAEFISFGWWMQEPASADGAYSFQYYADGTVYAPPTGTAPDTLTAGSATYSGRAAGQYAVQTIDDTGVTGGMHGEFTAAATLMATFGPTANTISGTISGFTAEDGSSPGWEVTLHQKSLGAETALGTGTPTGFPVSAQSDPTRPGYDGTTATMGNHMAYGDWTGQYFGNSTTSTAAYPLGVGGTFQADSEAVSIAGAFGARR